MSNNDIDALDAYECAKILLEQRRSELSEWELQLLPSVIGHYESRKHLTDRQVEKVWNIFDREMR